MVSSLVIVLLGCVIGSASVTHIDVNTGMGTVRGIEEEFQGTTIHTFRSIPYAKPPVGNRRFANPERIDPWEGVLDVTKRPSSCFQSLDTAFGKFEGVEMWNAKNKSEDCLYLTIHTPSMPDANQNRKALPVLVWVFGGGFFSGTTTLDMYDGRILAAEMNMVVVSIQYRVGTLGFMYLDASDAPGNQGLMDQAVALEWLNNRIGSFGGDRHSITLFGESAGAVSISYHLLSDVSRDLFTRAIMQSGTALCRWALETPEVAKSRYLELAEFMNCDTTQPVNEIIACLRDADPLELSEQVFATKNDYNLVTNVLATIDGTFLKEHPFETIQKGNMKSTDILLGSMKDEGAYFLVYAWPKMFDRWKNTSMPRSDYEQALRVAAQSDIQMLADAIEFEYEVPYDYENQARLLDILDNVVGDSDFICPVTGFAERYVQDNSNVYMYHFLQTSTHNPWPDHLGVMHGYEIDFVFGIPLKEGLNYSDEEKDFSRKLIQYWSNFAKTG